MRGKPTKALQLLACLCLAPVRVCFAGAFWAHPLYSFVSQNRACSVAPQEVHPCVGQECDPALLQPAGRRAHRVCHGSGRWWVGEPPPPAGVFASRPPAQALPLPSLQKSDFIATLCGPRRRSWKDPQDCCSKAEEGGALQACFDRNYLASIPLAGEGQPPQPTLPAE